MVAFDADGFALEFAATSMIVRRSTFSYLLIAQTVDGGAAAAERRGAEY
jgi:hypothetical protein